MRKHFYFLLTFLFLLLQARETTQVAYGQPSSFNNLVTAPPQVQGQSIINAIRDAAAVKNLPTQFGKAASAVLLRKVVTPHKVSESISEIMVKLVSQTEKLTVLVADLDADLRENTISLTAGYSCVDRGQSTGKAIMWHVAKDLEALSMLNDSVGSARESVSNTDDKTPSKTDISEQCWFGGADLTTPEFRQVETVGIHDGGGVRYKPILNVPKFNLSYEFFSRLLKRRKEETQQKEVVYDKYSKVPITFGLPFDTSVRVITPPDITNAKTREYRVPATIHTANRAHNGYRLAAANVSPGESRTTGKLVALSVLSSGLAVIIATWVVFKSIADGAKERMYKLRRLGIRSVILGQGGMDLASRMFILLQVLAGLILIAPMLQALFEGVADPRPSVEVTTIATVFYSRSYPEEKTMSDDKDNLFAGAAFQILVTTSMRQLDEGFYTEFVVALVSVIVASISVAMVELFRLACMMPCSDDPSYNGVSFWNMLGFFRLKYAPRRSDVAAIDLQRRYRVFVEFRDDMKWEELEEIYCLLLTSPAERQFSKQAMNRKDALNEKGRRQIVAMQLRHALEEHITPAETFGLVASIRMRDKDRLAAMLAKCKPWYARLPRAWYWITAAGGIESNCVEWFVCNGVLMPDRMLLASRLGLLDSMDKVKRISFRDATEVESRFDYLDGVKVELYHIARLDRFSPDFVGLADERAVQLEELGAVEVQRRFREGRLIKQSKLISVPPGLSIASLPSHFIEKTPDVSGSS